MARIYVTEPGTTGGVGAMGMRILVDAIRRDGHEVRRVRFYRKVEAVQSSLFGGIQSEELSDARGLPRPDAWFVSLLHVRQFWDLPDLFRRMGLALRSDMRADSDPLVAFGGASMIQPMPVADFADIIALGDGEATGTRIARMFDAGAVKLDIIRELDGERGFWAPNRSPDARLVRLETDIRDPVLRSGSDDTALDTIELARGCESKCAFCPIGWAGGTYREAPLESLKSTMVQLRGKRVNFFAPDYSSVSYVEELEREIDRAGCKNGGRDARLDAAHKHLRHGRGVKQYSFGIEGLSERLRRAVGKPLAREKIVGVMSELESSGVAHVKWYMILGMPGECDVDLAEFLALLEDVRGVFTGSLDVTTTHIHAIAHTPLQWIDARYSDAATQRKTAIFDTLRGWFQSGTIKNRWLQLNWNGRELHESDAYLLRTGRAASVVLESVNSNAAKVSDGRWRAHVSGIDAELSARAESDRLPWDCVDVGTPRTRVLAAWHNYQRLSKP